MCDIEKYSKIYKDIMLLQPEDTLQLIMKADDAEEQKFYWLVGNFLLQQKQRQVIANNLF